MLTVASVHIWDAFPPICSPAVCLCVSYLCLHLISGPASACPLILFFANFRDAFQCAVLYSACLDSSGGRSCRCKRGWTLRPCWNARQANTGSSSVVGMAHSVRSLPPGLHQSPRWSPSARYSPDALRSQWSWSRRGHGRSESRQGMPGKQ